MLDTHRRLFSSVYPWAGQDRTTLAPDITIGKGGISDLFAHPADVRRAAEYGLPMGPDVGKMRANPGEVFGALAYAHSFPRRQRPHHNDGQRQPGPTCRLSH